MGIARLRAMGAKHLINGEIVLATVVIVGLLTALVHHSDGAAVLPFDLHPCTSPPSFQPFQTQRGAATPVDEGWRIVNLSILQAQVCSPGVLEILADGEQAGGAAPAVEIALDNDLLAVERFADVRNVRVAVPSEGRLTVTYRKPYGRTEARSVILRSLQMPGCKNSAVSVPAGDTGAWHPGSGSATLYSRTPATLFPCTSGTLNLTVEGGMGNGAYPVLHLEQNGKLLLSHTTNGQPQRIRVELAQAPAAVYIANPYAKLLAQRVLNIRKLTFSPQQ